MTLEIIIFIAAILFGIIWYWRESRNNRLYRIANRITHSKPLQLAPDSPKGFIHQQPFLMRLVWITVFFVLSGTLISLATPINAFYLQYFFSAIVGTLIGSYVASAFLLAKESAKKENIERVIQKGRAFIEELEEHEGDTPEIEESPSPEPEKLSEKSARDRLRDKGMIK